MLWHLPSDPSLIQNDSRSLQCSQSCWIWQQFSVQICEMSYLVGKLATMNFSPFFLKGECLASLCLYSVMDMVRLPAILFRHPSRSIVQAHQVCSQTFQRASPPPPCPWFLTGWWNLIWYICSLINSLFPFSFFFFLFFNARDRSETWEYSRWINNLLPWVG